MIKCTLDQIFNFIEEWYSHNPKGITIWILTLLVAYRLIVGIYRGIIVSRFKAKNNEAIKRRLEERDHSFKYTFDISQILSPEIQKQIYDGDISFVRNLLQTGKITSEQLLKFYYMRTKTRGMDMNAVTDSNFEQALQMAKKADIEIKSKGAAAFKDKPLLGIPFSVKESIAMEGFSNTQGFPQESTLRKTSHVMLSSP